MPTASASASPLDATTALFDAQLPSWKITNAHTIATIRYVLRRTIKTGDESLTIGSIRHHFKDGPMRDAFEAWVLGLIRNTPGYPLEPEEQ